MGQINIKQVLPLSYFTITKSLKTLLGIKRYGKINLILPYC